MLATKQQLQPISYRTLASFLTVAVKKHSRFPFPDHSNEKHLYYNLLNSISTPTNTIILSLIYLSKLHVTFSPLLEDHPAILVYVACLSLTTSIADDIPYAANVWSKLSGYSIKHINSVVRTIMHTLDHRFNISSSAFYKYRLRVLKYMCPTSCLNHRCLITPPSSPDFLLPKPILPYPPPSLGAKNQSNDIFHPFL
ncbi:hypothetical protein DSO57_1037038 [Entomophthora muscae]|uniref:Uncharacterized protein n=1 Tax=Entomophthora muscae TaxID=34485 RepID=A0ACC2RQ18_9FUNG|nr:hypothetical protein DSO57_1037038 [Entomophthora muscae]